MEGQFQNSFFVALSIVDPIFYFDSDRGLLV